jgi:3-methyl-2-oxobutanoate hydroxymethyltransferase
MSQRLTVRDIAARKNGTPLVVLTCYTAPMARLLDPHVDILLVGDSLGMVVYGMPSTQAVQLDMMINHGKAVAAQAKHAFVVVDLPFGTYETSKEQALASCRRVMSETGAGAIKLEGGRDTAPTIAYLVQQGVPVMGHVGLMPQRVSTPDGFRYQGRTPQEASAILADAKAVAEAGAFALVIEAVKEDVARHITAQINIPTIGIGASPACDGQVLVIDDMLGMFERTPSFVKRYEELTNFIEKAVKSYASEVKSRAFPSAEFCFPFKKK